MKLVVVPASNEHPDVLALLHKLYSTIAMRLCPTEHLAQNAGVHAIEGDWLEAEQQCTTGMSTYKMAKENH